MISPQEIRAHALKWWILFLQSHLKNEPFFPKTIDRIGKITSSSVREKISELQIELNELYTDSKEKTGSGYVVNKENVNFRRTGSHLLPQSVTFETAADYIAFIGKKKEWNSFLKNTQLIRFEIPQLNDWIFNNPQVVIDAGDKWPDLIKVSKYFFLNPKPELYIRQLPVDLHTKFIEQNQAVILSLLDFLIPDAIRDSSDKSISRRYYLKYDEPTIRLRILDRAFKIGCLSDLRIPLTDFEKLNTSCTNIILTENKMNFLALPELPSTVAIWSGGGFMISYLKNTAWLNDKSVFYWGDLDTHGFLMLHQMRSYFQQTKAVMMDRKIFDLFKHEGLVSGKKTSSENLSTLTEAEMEMFIFLKTNNFRLEQEKIKQQYADNFLRELLFAIASI